MGVRLMANLFRPAVERPYPAIISVTPYGKDVLPGRIHTNARVAGCLDVDLGFTPATNPSCFGGWR